MSSRTSLVLPLVKAEEGSEPPVKLETLLLTLKLYSLSDFLKREKQGPMYIRLGYSYPRAFLILDFRTLSIYLFLSQPVGCDHELGSNAVLDACGVCKGDNSTCKFYKGLYLNQHKANGKRRLLFRGCGFAAGHV